ncbi:ATP-binding cassette sub-family A member 17 [Nymphon striatum]|nr:ATP-binding cassette sub-family A member 17 [Nymphon striatum]
MRYFSTGRSIITTQRAFRTHFKIAARGRVPRWQSIVSWVNNFRETGDVKKKKPWASTNSKVTSKHCREQHSSRCRDHTRRYAGKRVANLWYYMSLGICITINMKMFSELLKTMGLRNWVNFVTWFINGFIMFFIINCFVLIYVSYSAVSLTPALFAYSNKFLLFLILNMYSVSIIMFCICISVFFPRGNFKIKYIFVPGVQINCIHSLIYYKLHCSVIVHFRTNDRIGAQWDNLNTGLLKNDPFTLSKAMWMMVASWFIQFFIIWYFDGCWPWQNGVPKPFYFPFMIFNGKTAVNGISLDLYKGQITALLGHNGAGKTTTISVITGMYPPTDGTVLVNGFDVCKNLNQARKSMGYCPQISTYFNELTVAEHLNLIATLKGYPSSDMNNEIDRIISQVNLQEKKNSVAQSLSGGMKRKLSLAMALIGDTKVLLLDEPTAGLDPEARKEVWNILQSIRSDRTVLLTTHYMEEADALGDRIAIMHEGLIFCAGSPLYLKNKFGAGYHLRMVKKDGFDNQIVMDYVNQILPAKAERDSGREFSLIIEFEHVAKFPGFFEQFQADLDKLKVESFSVSVTNMEDVFLKGISLIFMQFYGLFLKRFHHNKRQISSLLVQILFPLVIMGAIVAISKVIVQQNETPPGYDVKLNIYEDPKVLLRQNVTDHEIATRFKDLVKSEQGKVIPTHNITKSALDIANRHVYEYLKEYPVAAEINQTGKTVKLNALYNRYTAYGSIIIGCFSANSVAFNEGTISSIIDPLDDIFRLIPAYALGRGVSSISLGNSLAKQCPRFKKFCAESTPGSQYEVCCRSTPYNIYGMDKTESGQEIVYLICSGLLFWLIIILSESRISRIIRKSVTKYFVTDDIAFDLPSSSDEDVIEEENDTLNSNTGKSHALVVQHLRKKYKKCLAVADVSFRVVKEECFGLLGINGAGKTTTFSMLTGDVDMTCGNAFSDVYNVENDLTKFQSQIGYCPQFDPLLELLTGREMLFLFARLRGIQANKIIEVVKTLIELVDLTHYADKKCGIYSGGNKRKLSIALAIMGTPPLVFLDEPTAGIDPVARRQVWDLLTAIKSSGTSVVLTSHSMEECEALCDRLTIMVRGKLQCIGSVSHLKNKYGQGYTIYANMKLIQDGHDDNRRLQIVQATQAKIPSLALKYHNLGILTLHVNDAQENWAHMFEVMEQIKKDYQLENYAITATTLEEVFLSFARQ